MSTKKIANIAMLVALAIIFSYVEVLIPINIGIPGVKLGLANLVIVIALYSLDMGDVWLISLVRIVLVGFMVGSLMSIAYSLAGAIVSLIAMMIIKKTDFFGIMGVSIIGGSMSQYGTDSRCSICSKKQRHLLLCSNASYSRSNYRWDYRSSFP